MTKRFCMSYEIESQRETYSEPAYVRLHRMGSAESTWMTPEEARALGVALVAAAGAGLRRYICSLQLSNNSAVATEVVLKDGATIIWRGHLSANAPMAEIIFENPLRTTANTALNFACITTGAAVYVNAQGFTAP